MKTKFFSNYTYTGDTQLVNSLVTTATCLDGYVISMTPKEAICLAEELQRVTETFFLMQNEGEK